MPFVTAKCLPKKDQDVAMSVTEVRVLLSACSLIGQIFGTFFPLLLKINKVAEMTIDSQINLLVDGID